MGDDNEAPYGRHPDGTPKRSNGGRPAGTGTRRKRATAKPKATAPPRKPAANSAPRNKPEKVNYAPAASEFAMLIGAVVYARSPLDGAVAMSSADEFGQCVDELAQINDYVRKACEKVLVIGPYGRITALALRIGAQVAENHQWLPQSVTGVFGAVPRAQFAAQFGQFADHAAADAAVRDDLGQPGPDDVPPFAYGEYQVPDGRVA
jgi:hypothetical protein